jgi:Sulfotransferase domain
MNLHQTTVHAINNETKPQPRSGLVWLASYPKSGNTWTRAFLSNLAIVLSGENEGLDINSINRFTIGENFQQFYEERLGFKPTEEHRKEIAALRHQVQEWIADQFEGLVFVKTHNGLVLDHGRCIINFAVTSGAIYIVRNPLDVAISLAHHMGKTIDGAIETMARPDTETPINEKRVHEIWGSWTQHVESWTRKPHPAIYVMRYEDMLAEPTKIFGGLAGHLHLDPTSAQLALAIERSSFSKLRSQEEKEGFKEKSAKAERFFREGRAGQWKETLNPTQIERIVNDHGKQMTRFGYLPLA